ncbi:hypothetical protein PR202_gb05373 [Eleusine coracana subsp. coracana]|uniref:Uncharacterized protein n=1 Tax=Eleusine coracana subsp. coracana TaxID=191504 RepID=A0AAV5E720_ELECO|nr:hypothetical protein PR202_gb05373 [Eleusine coracana subsp. coracana]
MQSLDLKIQHFAEAHSYKVVGEDQNLHLELESKMQKLDSRSKELDELASQSDYDRRKLEQQKHELEMNTEHLRMARLEQERAQKNLLKLVEEQKGFNDFDGGRGNICIKRMGLATEEDVITPPLPHVAVGGGSAPMTQQRRTSWHHSDIPRHLSDRLHSSIPRHLSDRLHSSNARSLLILFFTTYTQGGLVSSSSTSTCLM